MVIRWCGTLTHLFHYYDICRRGMPFRGMPPRGFMRGGPMRGGPMRGGPFPGPGNGRGFHRGGPGGPGGPGGMGPRGNRGGNFGGNMMQRGGPGGNKFGGPGMNQGMGNQWGPSPWQQQPSSLQRPAGWGSPWSQGANPQQQQGGGVWNHNMRPQQGNQVNISLSMGSGCGSVGRMVASKTRDPRLESSHR